MAKYIILNSPFHGHVNPTLTVVRELVRRGEQVIYYLTSDFQDAVSATGATFRSYESTLNQLPVPSEARQRPEGLPFKMVRESQHVLPQVLEDIWSEEPDFIIYEAMCMWGRFIAEILHIPAILLRPSYASNEHFNLMAAPGALPFAPPPAAIDGFGTMIANLCKQYAIPQFGLQNFLSHAEPLTIVFLPRAFQPAGETFDDHFVFVGPSLALRHNETSFQFISNNQDDQPVLYISLGTVFNEQPTFFQICFEAFGNQPWRVVLSHGQHIDQSRLGPIPQNFQLASYIPQLEVLQQASVFLTHGGMNSVMESLYYGVPMVVIPQMIEQSVTAYRIEELGLGVRLDPHTLSMKKLREAVTFVHTDHTIHERIGEMQQIIRTCGGHRQAADAIENFSAYNVT